jgi:hypothetical protein
MVTEFIHLQEMEVIIRIGGTKLIIHSLKKLIDGILNDLSLAKLDFS